MRRPGRRLSSQVLAITVGFATLSGVAPAFAKPALAVLGVEAIDDSGDAKKQNETSELARLLTEALRARADAARNTFDSASGNKDLVEVKLLDCPDDADLKCMAKVGQDLGAKRLIYGSLKRLREGGFAASLRFINVETKVSERTVADKLPADAANPVALKKAAAKYFASLSGIAATGEIVISVSDPVGGTVTLDRGATVDLIDGTATLSDVSAGSHTIEIDAPGFQHYSSSVEVEAAGKTKLDADLIANLGRRAPRWWRRRRRHGRLAQAAGRHLPRPVLELAGRHRGGRRRLHHHGPAGPQRRRRQEGDHPRVADERRREPAHHHHGGRLLRDEQQGQQGPDRRL